MTIDPFDGVFDNLDSGCREKYADGRLIAYVRKTCLGGTMLDKLGMSGPWGSFPVRPVGSINEEVSP